MPKHFLLFLGGLFAGVLLLGGVLFLSANFPDGAEKREKVDLESALELVRQNRIRELKILEDRIEFDSKDGRKLELVESVDDATQDMIFEAVRKTETTVTLQSRSGSLYWLIL